MQLSSFNKTDGKLLLSRDSNFAFAYNFLVELSKYEDIVLLVPSKEVLAEDDIEILDELGKFVSTVEYDYILNPFLQRFFVSKEILKIAKDVSPDFIFCNDPTHVLNWKVASSTAKIAVYNHWISLPNHNVFGDNYYLLRQVEGLQFADYVFTNTLVSKAMLLEQYRIARGASSPDLYDKIHILPPPILEKFLASKPKSGDKVRTFLYNNRLSSFEEYQQCLNFFIDMANKLYEEDVIFKTIFTNPSGYSLAFDKLKQLHAFRKMNYEEYMQMMKKETLIGGAFFDKERIWSIALMDLAANANAVIAPMHSCFIEMFATDVLYRNPERAKFLLKELLTDGEAYARASKLCLEDARKFTSDKIVEKFLEVVK